MRNIKNLFLLGLIILVSGTCAFAQDQTGMIYGNVANEDGAIIAGAKVIAESPALIRPFETVTNARGRYVLPVLPVGTYRITVTAENYQGTTLEDIGISVNNRLRIDIVLKTGVVGEEIVVITGDAPLVDVTKTDTGMNISKELFDKLPKGRNFQSIVALAPGATDESAQFGGIMIDGASSSENVFVIDGAGTNDLIGGRNAQGAVFEFVEEVQVRSGGYEAEYGGSMGGVVNVVTRSGGNEFSGSLIGYYQGDSLTGDNRPILRLNPWTDDPEYFTAEKDEFSRFDIGGSLGGYILKDRVWFFASYLPWFEDRERTVDYYDTDDNGNPYVWTTETTTRERQQHNAAAKVSIQITDRWNASVSGSTDWWKTVGELASTQGLDLPTSYSPDRGWKYPGLVVAARSDYFVSDNLYISGTLGYHRTNVEGIGRDEGPPDEPRHLFQYAVPDAYAAMMPADRVHGTFWSNYAFASLQQFVKDENEQLSSTLTGSYFVELAGDHQWKTGFQSYWIHNQAEDFHVNQYYRYYWDDSLYNPLSGEFERGEYGFYRVYSNDFPHGLKGEASSYRYALFLQDNYSPNDRLTINVGVRAESEKLPAYIDGQDDALDFGFADKIAPRIGISYDVLGDGKLKAFANFGVYYDVMKLEMAREGYGGRNFKLGYYKLDRLDYWNFPNVIGNDAPYPGEKIYAINYRAPAFETTDPDTEPMGIFEYIAGIDWQFSDNMSVNVRFVHKTLRKAIEDVGFFVEGFDLFGDLAEHYWHGNPGYGRIAELTAEAGLPNAKAVRDYTGLDIRLLKRFSNNWTGGANVTFSRTHGNYSGLTNTDEGDRDSPNVNRNFDAWYASTTSTWDDNSGVLNSDRRYTVTLFGSYLFDEGMLDGLVIGFQQIINDGTPFTTELILNGINGYVPYERGDQGRYDMYTQTDLYAEYNFRLNESYTLNFNVNITNLFDQDTELSRWRSLSDSDQFTVRYDENELVRLYQSGQPVPISEIIGSEDSIYGPIASRFGMSNLFQGARSIRLGAKLTF